MDEFLRLLDEARADERSDARARERFLRQAAEEGASLAGTLLDLAEAGTTVAVRTTEARVHTGVLRLVAADFVVLGTEAAGDVWLALAGVTSVRPGFGGVAAAGDRPSADVTLVDALAMAAGERPRVLLVVAGGEPLAGELRAVGADVVTLRLDGAGVAYVSASAIRAVLRSG